MAEPRIARLDEVASVEAIARLPYSLRVLLENVVRAGVVGEGDPQEAQAILDWQPGKEPHREMSFRPARVLLQDFTGVPAIVDLAAMRAAMRDLGGEAARINPLLPSELVIDHSVQVDVFGSKIAIFKNTELEFERNRERYAFLRWGQEAFDDLRVVPPNTGIVHQVNLEYLARVVEERDGWAFPDTLVGTDSHTTMVNSLGVLGWGVGGIEAEAAMLGEPLSMLVPQVVGFRLSGRLPEGSTATDLVLTVTETLRNLGVVGKFVEFFGPGLSGLTLADRATIANMSPEYGATCGFFPVDEETLAYLRMTGRSEKHVSRVESYCRAQLLFHDEKVEPAYSEVVDLDLGSVEPSLAGPRRPQDRVALREARDSFLGALPTFGVEYGNHDNAVAETFPASDPTTEQAPGGDGAHAPEPERSSVAVSEVEPASVEVELDDARFELGHGSVVIAAITSCTNTSNPTVMVAAGLLARNAVERGLKRRPWVKSSLAPGSKVVTEYYDRAGLSRYLDELGFDVVGYGCTTCIGNSGPLPEEISAAVEEGGLVVCSVLSGNRNFEARIHPEVKANYLASPPLVVAYALAGRMDVDLTSEPLGQDPDGNDVFLTDVWPTPDEVQETIASALQQEMFTRTYADVFTGDERWRELDTPEGELFDWEPESTYVRLPPYFEGMSPEPGTVDDFAGARCLVRLGDSVTTDHISPAGAIKPESPAGRYLTEHGVERKDFNSYGSRRGNHEVMVRGTFANVRLRNLLVPGSEGTWTVHLPDGEEKTIFDAAERYRSEGVPLVVLAGKEYGSGSSRDWAAKGPKLLGVRAVIAESYERIHRSNLIGMGVLPLQYMPGENAESLGLSGREEFSIAGVENGEADNVTVRADDTEFRARLRADTPRERDYLRHGGVLPYALRGLLRA
jgi:aconitate hydratase